MGGNGGEVLGNYLGEGVKRGPTSSRLRILRLDYAKETDAGGSCAVVGGLPWWERFYGVDLLLQRS